MAQVELSVRQYSSMAQVSSSLDDCPSAAHCWTLPSLQNAVYGPQTCVLHWPPSQIEPAPHATPALAAPCPSLAQTERRVSDAQYGSPASHTSGKQYQ
jgi:hypothetical protein